MLADARMLGAAASMACPKKPVELNLPGIQRRLRNTFRVGFARFSV